MITRSEQLYELLISQLKVAEEIAYMINHEASVEEDTDTISTSGRKANDLAAQLEGIFDALEFNISDNFKLNFQAFRPIKIKLGNQFSDMKRTFMCSEDKIGSPEDMGFIGK